MFHWYLPGSSTPVRPAGVSSVSLVSSWFVYSCQTCRSQWCFIGIFLVRLLLSDLPESVVFHWYLPGSSTPVLSTAVSSNPISSTAVLSNPISSTAVSSNPISSTAVSSNPISSTAVSSNPILSTAVSSTAQTLEIPSLLSYS